MSLLLCLGGMAGCGSNVAVSNLQLTLSPATLVFGIAGLHAASAAQTLTLTNSGMAEATITGTTVSGDFSVVGNSCGATLAVGSTCQVGVVFTPTMLGARTGAVTVGSNAGMQTAQLAGTGGTSLASLSQGALSFGLVAVGSSSAAQTLTITSSGTAPLALSSVLLAGDFAETANTCTAVLAAGASCQVGVDFTPGAFGVRGGTLTLASNSTLSPQQVQLSGTGTTPQSYAGSGFSVVVKAGDEPVAGSAVQLYAAGTSGNGSAGSALLANGAVTGGTGSATIPAGFLCPGADSLLYLVSSGGTVGTNAAANASLRWMTAVGPCSAVAAGSTYTLDEATTVASAYALAQFYANGSQVGASASNGVGLANAFLTAATLVDPVAGTSPGATLPAQAVSPAPRVNAVANIVNACAVNASACGAFFSATVSATAGTTMPTNTLDAVVHLAQQPAVNVAALYGQSLLSKAYGPALTRAPADWTMFLTLSGGGLNSPSGIGVDGTGSVWVANYFNAATKLSPTGAAVFASGVTGFGIENSYGLAIDANNEVWIPNEVPFTATGIGSVTELTSSGAALSGASGYQDGGLDYPLSVAIDPNGTVWVVDFGNSHLTLLDQLGTPLSGNSGYTTPLFAFPIVVAVDANHFGWVGNQASTFVTRVAPDGSSFVNYNCCNGAAGIALDQGNNVWVANYYGNNVSLITSTGAIASAGAYTGLGSLDRPQGIAVDGAGNVWVANYRMPYLTELSGVSSGAPGISRSPATGLGADSGLLEAYALALDASGNVWVSNQGSNTVTKFVGLAVPVKTPLSGLPKAP